LAQTNYAGHLFQFLLIIAKYKCALKNPSIDRRIVEFVPIFIFKGVFLSAESDLAAITSLVYTGQTITDATNATFTTNAIDG